MASEPVTIGILECDRPAEHLRERHGTYARMFERLFGAAAPDWQFRDYAAFQGELPASARECAGWLVTGSRHGVYDGLAWMEHLKGLLREAVDLGVPVAGICFGHQILAEALGGRVVKSGRGWGLGTQRYRMLSPPDWLSDEASEILTLNAVHQDQVVELPPGAEVIAASDFCPYAALLYDDRAISFQAHPEFGYEFQKALLDVLANERGVISAEHARETAAALDEAAVAADAARVARWVVRLFERRLRPGAAY